MTALLSTPELSKIPESSAALTNAAVPQVRVTRSAAPDIVISFDPDAPSWLRDIAHRLDELAAFPDSWDGFDACQLADEAAMWMLQVLQQVAVRGVPVPDMILSREGGLQVEWHEGGWDVEIEVRPNGDVEAWAKRIDGTVEPLWSETLVDLPRFVDVLRSLADVRG